MKVDLTSTPGAAWLDRDVVSLHGPDAIAFAQGQLSQDVDALAVAGSAFSFVLSPRGMVDAFVRVTRTGADRLVLDLDAGFGPALIARLERFKLRIEAETASLDWRVLALRGPGSSELAVSPFGPDGSTWRLAPETHGAEGVDLLGPEPDLPRAIEMVDAESYEALRVATGTPRMGQELDDSTIPAASGLVDRSVSFTKGCFTGQELVARIDSRGGATPTRLRGIVAEAGAVLRSGEEVRANDKVVATITSAADHLALAYVRREVTPPADAVVGSTAVRVVELPMRA